MAYTPGLKVKRLVIVRKTRRLPLKGTVLVEKGDIVSQDSIIARTELPGDPELMNMALKLGVNPNDKADSIVNYMYKKEGDSVKEGEIIAGYSQFFGLFKKSIPSPVSGVIELISALSGQVIMRGDPIPVEVSAYIPGTISNILPGEGATIDCPAAFIQGIFGLGGENHGEILVFLNNPSAEDVTADCAEKILVIKRVPETAVINKAIAVGVKGLVCGGIEAKTVIQLMGQEIGVAITGHEDLGLTIVVTEGFGKMEMSEKTFGLFKEFEGKRASINGATQIRAGVMRPEIIIPQETKGQQLSMYDVEDTAVLSQGLQIGTPVRIIRGPYFGQLGSVSALPPALQFIATDSRVRVLETELEDGRKILIPRANVEIIGE